MHSVPPLSLYVHLPWCVRKCPYCDFNSHAVGAALPEREYVAALLADLDTDREAMAGREVSSVFIGGGTPSLFGADSIARLLDGVRARVRLDEDAEITLEANPGSAEAGKFLGFREAGVNRLSIGVQSFESGLLTELGRIHGREEGLRAADLARDAGFANFNLDLMFGLPGQRPDQALADVATAIRLQPTHLSFYQLTLEPNTRFHKYPPALPDEDTTWTMQQECQTLLAAAGYAQYEISAYAREGYRCRHNLNYWQFGDYLGIGAGAHGKLTDPATGRITRAARIRHPGHYLEARSRAERLATETVIEPAQLPFEFLMNALRLREGYAEPDFAARTGLRAEALEPELSACTAAGLLERGDGRVRCSAHGYLFLDDILQRFLP